MKLNNMKIYIHAVLFALALSGCSLVYDPVDTYSDVTEGYEEESEKIAFKDKAAVESHLKTLYRQMKDRQEHWYIDLLLLSESHSDNAYAGTTGAEVLPFENNSIEGSNSVLQRDWERYMEDVGRANKLIVNIDSVQDDSFTSEERQSVKAQALIFRSLVYFDMVRIWGNIPLILTEAGDITSETIGEVFDEYFPAQSSESEVYEQIEVDLLEALNYAPDNDAADKTKFSKSVAKAMLAKIYAEKPIQNYEKVIQYIDELEEDGFDLNGDFSDLFAMNGDNSDIKIRNTQESILEVQFFPGSGNWASWMFGRNLVNWDENFTWAKWVTPSRDLISLFQTEGDEIRFKESVVYYKTTWSNYYPSDNYPFMYKMRSGVNSIIKLRYADLLLLKAEALIMKDSPNLNEAADIINKIRKRVELSPLNVSEKSNKESLLKALLKERRLELAFEGQRWFDLVRLDKVEEVMNAVYAKDPGRKNQVYPYNEFSYRLAIPQTVIDQNSKIEQNPGY